jgi:hypothetical protein
MRRFGTTTNKLPLQQFRRPPRTPVISRIRIANMGYISNPQAESTVRDWGFPNVCTFVDEPFVTHFNPFDRLSTPLGRNRHKNQQGWRYLTCACPFSSQKNESWASRQLLTHYVLQTACRAYPSLSQILTETRLEANGACAVTPITRVTAMIF